MTGSCPLRIGIDSQALQTPGSRRRGIGVYTRSLINELITHGSDEYCLFFNSIHDATEVPLESVHCHTIHYESQTDAQTCRSLNEYLQRLAYEAHNLDVLHIASPVEDRDAVIMAPVERRPFPVVCTLFDLIPLVFESVYLKHPAASAHYRERIEWYLKADIVIAISENSRRDAIRLLGIAEDHIVNVGAAVDPFFRKLDWQTRLTACQVTKAELGIRSRFVLFTGGFDFRKNLEGMIRAFSLVPERARHDCQLVIVCALQTEQAETLQNRAKECGVASSLVLTNYVSDQSLLHLYNCCDLFVFPSLYEGFGLPVLEAMSCGAAVIASNTSSIPEIVGDAGIQVDPADPDVLARAMDSVLASNHLRDELREKALLRARLFSWDATAQATRRAYSLARERWTASVSVLRARKPKLAYFSPLPPQESGISDYSAELLPHLAKHFEIDAYVDGYTPAVEPHDGMRISASVADLKENAYFSFLFQMGNSIFHAYIYDALIKHAGITVLHDVSLHDLVYWMLTQRRRSPERYAEELTYENGLEAQIAVEMVDAGELSQHGLVELFPMNGRVLDASKAIVVHSAFARGEITAGRSRQAAQRVRHINEGMTLPLTPSTQEKKAFRRSVGLPEDAFVVGTFGIMSEQKQLEEGLQAFARMAAQFNAHYVGVGRFVSLGYKTSIVNLCATLGITQRVAFKGRVSLSDYYRYLFACDAVLNLRYPSRGETSATLLRAMSCALPTIVNDIAAFAELPHDVVMKVNIGPRHAEDLSTALRLLAADERVRRQRGDAARQHIADHHNWEMIAAQYADFIQHVEMTGLGDQGPLREVIDSLVATARQHATNDSRRLDRAIAALTSSEALGRILWV